MPEHRHDGQGSSGGPRRWIFWGFLAIAAYFLLTEHRAHFIQYLPFVLVLACPLMHFLHGHGGHGGHGKPDPKDGEKRDEHESRR